MRHALRRYDRGKLIHSVIFFTLFFIFVWLWVDPKLLYYGRTQLISGLGRGFLYTAYYTWTFDNCPLRPGEPTDYLALCFSHFYRYSWLGALLITATAWLLSFGSNRVITTIGDNRFSILRFVPPVIMGVLFCRYDYSVRCIADSLGLTVALLMSYLYMRFSPNDIKSRILSFLVLLAGVYILASFSYIVFILLCCIFELFIRRNWLVAICMVISGGTGPYLMSNIYSCLTLTDAYHYTYGLISFRYGIDNLNAYLKLGLYLSIPFVAVVCILGQIFAATTSKPAPSSNDCKTIYSSRLAWVIQTLILLAVSLAVVLLANNLTLRRHLRIHYFARQQMWPDLLRQAQVFRNNSEFSYDPFVCSEINRALYHTGKLADEMFYYPQQPSGLLLDFPEPLQGHWKIRAGEIRSDLLYELGHINLAESHCYELLTRFHHCPWVLKKLALINIIKRQPDAARVYLIKLLDDPYCHHRNWACNYLKKLNEDPFLMEDEHIRQQRSLIIPSDTVILKDYILKLLESDIPNRMAFEYFAAQCLTNGELRRFAALIQYLRDFNFYRIPSHYQEAILLYSRLTKKRLDLHGYQLDPQVCRRFDDFMRILRNNKNDKAAARSALRHDYSNTFYFYYYFIMLRRTAS